ncbi:MAG: hypothetical protein Q4C63_06020 [Eubacteriales bacterium]|nr:hypothetical protein [Eubacteriales bacterium]
MAERIEERPKANGMAIASLIMGIIAIPASFLLLGGMFAGLGITFSLLSRGERKLSGVAVAGLVCSLFALVPSFVISALLLSYSGSGAALLSGGGLMSGFVDMARLWLLFIF